MNGGYVMIKATDTELYKKLNVSLELGKPILFYEDDNTCYYIDTITKADDTITLTKGGKTIQVASDGTITESGTITSKMYNIFIEFEDNDNKSNITLQVDDDSIQTYQDLYNYLNKKGFVCNYDEIKEDYKYIVLNACGLIDLKAIEQTGLVTGITIYNEDSDTGITVLGIMQGAPSIAGHWISDSGTLTITYLD